MIIRLCFLRLSARGTFVGHGAVVDLKLAKALRVGHGHYFCLWRDIPLASARPNPLDHIFFEEVTCFPFR